MRLLFRAARALRFSWELARPDRTVCLQSSPVLTEELEACYVCLDSHGCTDAHGKVVHQRVTEQRREGFLSILQPATAGASSDEAGGGGGSGEHGRAITGASSDEAAGGEGSREHGTRGTAANTAVSEEHARAVAASTVAGGDFDGLVAQTTSTESTLPLGGDVSEARQLLQEEAMQAEGVMVEAEMRDDEMDDGGDLATILLMALFTRARDVQTGLPGESEWRGSRLAQQRERCALHGGT